MRVLLLTCIIIVSTLVSCVETPEEQTVETQAASLGLNTSANYKESELKNIPIPTMPTFPETFEKEDVWRIKDNFETKVWRLKDGFETDVWREKDRVETVYWRKFDKKRKAALEEFKALDLDTYYKYLDAKEHGETYSFFENNKHIDCVKNFDDKVEGYREEYSKNLDICKEYYSNNLSLAKKFYSEGLSKAKEWYGKNN